MFQVDWHLMTEEEIESSVVSCRTETYTLCMLQISDSITQALVGIAAYDPTCMRMTTARGKQKLVPLYCFFFS